MGGGGAVEEEEEVEGVGTEAFINWVLMGLLVNSTDEEIGGKKEDARRL